MVHNSYAGGGCNDGERDVQLGRERSEESAARGAERAGERAEAGAHVKWEVWDETEHPAKNTSTEVCSTHVLSLVL